MAHPRANGSQEQIQYDNHEQQHRETTSADNLGAPSTIQRSAPCEPEIGPFVDSPSPTYPASSLDPLQVPSEVLADSTSARRLDAHCCLARNDEGVPSTALVRFEYLNQGGANVIFKILPWWHASVEPGPPFVFLDAKIDGTKAIPLHRKVLLRQVLRVNKGLEKTLRCDEVIFGFYNHVRPLFLPGSIEVVHTDSETGTMTVVQTSLPSLDLTNYLMEHRGVMLYSTVMAYLSSKSDAIVAETHSESSTSSHLTAKRWGICLPDMSPMPGSSVTLEIKPKWLAQSPTAPKNAQRCRTCALQVAKPKDPNKYLCPLLLVEGSRDDLYPWVSARVEEQLAGTADLPTRRQMELITHVSSQISTYLSEGDGRSLLRHIRLLQTLLDPQGVLGRDQFSADLRPLFDYNLRLAMTLRDCSLYIKVGYTTSKMDAAIIDCRLGDMDFKSPDKIVDWHQKEWDLINCAAYSLESGDHLGCVILGKARRRQGRSGSFLVNT
ncbi:inositol-pentakisphosphate 2-kinase-domain-containing protein [Paraphoma chrysanthemicola]|uniref:Inositol-pentakisphosphate 2-kinase n=1 Tax=Paraphoma chrysanthemicola TaxID=798071 RepID=A0A8K0VUM2_9PLEO|nr:inositol-pentakisphosphate 2-kinase-domain-containing protein [Paraphoma chrysanthemicola]